MRKLFELALLSIIACLYASGGAMAACERHIYNDTACNWYVLFKSTQGGTHVEGYCVQPSPPFYRIAPGCAANLSYTTSAGMSSGGVLLTPNPTPPLRNAQSFPYGNIVVDQCPRIGHNGVTRNVALNDSADGDIHIFAGCPSAPPTPFPTPKPTPGPCMLGLCPPLTSK